MICVRVAYFLTIAHSLSTGQSTHLRASAVERIGNGKRACIDQSDSAQKKREILNLAQSRVCGKFKHGGEVSQTLFSGNLLFSFALASPPRDIRKASVPLPHSTLAPHSSRNRSASGFISPAWDVWHANAELAGSGADYSGGRSCNSHEVVLSPLRSPGSMLRSAR
jgi:hypothetical protein